MFGLLLAIPSKVSAYTAHAPIFIEGDRNFTAANGVTGGSGTQSDPYVIEGWEINASAQNGIDIRNATAHFLIRNASVHDGDSFYAGIVLVNVSHARIETVNLTRNYVGIDIESSSGVVVDRSEMSRGLDGVRVYYSRDVEVRFNKMMYDGYPVSSYRSDNLTVAGNIMESTWGIGVHLYEASHASIAANWIIRSGSGGGQGGIFVQRSNNVSIERNNVTRGWPEGIHFWGTRDIAVACNVVWDSPIGIAVEIANANVTVYHNGLLNNTIQAKDDTDPPSAWDNGYPSGGNYWSDYNGTDQFRGPNQDQPGADGIGDAPYIIDPDSRDRYPMMSPNACVPVRPGPVTTLVVGQPKVTANLTYVTSLTPLTLIASSELDVTTAYSEYRIDQGNWAHYTAPFTLSGDGVHLLEFRSADVLGNLGPANRTALAVDDMPPTSGLLVGQPSVVSGGTWVTSSTPLEITAREATSGNGTFVNRSRDLRVFEERPNDGETFEGYLARANLTISRVIWPRLASVTFRITGPMCLDTDLGIFLDANEDGIRQVSELVGQSSGPSSDETVILSTPSPGPYIIAIAGFNEPPGGCLVDAEVVQEFEGPASSGLSRVQYRHWDSVTWTPWQTYLGIPLALSGADGPRTIEFRSEDRLGNAEVANSLDLILDNTPPETAVVMGTPRYQGNALYVKSSTGITLTASDGGLPPVGIAVVECRMDGGAWSPCASPLRLVGPDGHRVVGYRSTDLLGNTETERTVEVVVDDTAPTTSITPAVPPFLGGTLFTLNATDSGSGVNYTEYRVDGGTWTPYTTPFTLPDGGHTVGHRSVDNLGNVENERILVVPAEVVLPVALDWKPFIALVFSLVLVLAGAWSSRRAPWKGGKGRRAALTALAFTTLPFVVLEAATGIASLFLTLLSIPPVLGVGTAVDVGIFVAGLALAVYRGVKGRPSVP